jgi:two-component system, NarL family, sensor kinase
VTDEQSVGGAALWVHHLPMASRRPRWLWALAACGPLMLATFAVGAAVAGLHQPVSSSDLFENLYPNIVNGTLMPVLGALILQRLPRHAVGLVFMVCGLVAAATFPVFGYAYLALVAHPGSLPAGVAVAWVSSWLWAFGLMPLVTIGVLMFPDGRLPSRRWRPLLVLDVAAIAVVVVSTALTPGPLNNHPVADNPLGVPIARDVMMAAQSVGFVMFLVGTLGSLASVAVRWRRADSVQRSQLSWFLLAVAMIVGAIVIPPPIAYALALVAFPLLPVAVAVAILRRNLYGFDIVVRRSLVYAVLTGTLLLGYAAVVAGLGLLLGSRADGVAALVGTALVAVAFAPLRSRLQAAADRLLYGEGRDPYAILTGVGRRLGEPDADDGLGDVAEIVASALRLPYVRVSIQDGENVLQAEHGSHAGDLTDLVEIPIEFRGTPLGTVVVAPRGARDPFRPADRRLLEDLARQIGVSAHAILLTRALQESREGLVTTREEERRRIRRDLHDGLGPTLAGVALGLDAVGRMTSSRPAAAADLAQQLKAEVHGSLADVRRLVEDLRPPALDHLGLAGAVRRHGTQLGERDAGLQVDVEVADELSGLPAAVEVAAYRIATEALTNVARHATARHCRVGIELCRDVLVVEVEDDGVGLPEDVRSGVGLTSMRERATELGGSCELRQSARGGTVVEARIPVVR